MKKYVFIVLAVCLMFSKVYAQPDPGLDKIRALLPRLEMIINKAMQEAKVPGAAIGIVYKDQVVLLKGFGLKTLGKQERVNEETIFQIGSISKSFTSTLVAMLVDEKKLAWDDTVLKHFPGFMMFDPWVTRAFMIEDLMAQHSGLPPTAGDLQILFDVDSAHIIHSLRYIKPVSSFRTEFAYQNGLFLVTGHIIELLTGKTWEQNLQQRIFEPLGMLSTTASYPEFQQAANRVSFHQNINGTIQPLAQDWIYGGYVDLVAPAGSINSNVKDMVKYLQFHMNQGKFNNKQLLSAHNMHVTHSPKTIIPSTSGAPQIYYAEGWIYQEYRPSPVIWHNGETSGAKNMLAFMPDEKIGIVVLSNLRATQFPEQIAWSFFELYFDKPLTTMKPKPEPVSVQCNNPPAKASPAMPLEKYAGVYNNQVYGTMHIFEKNGGLFATMGSRKTEMPLQHWNRDIFCLQLPVVDAPADGFAYFKVNPEGRIEGVTLDAFNAGDIGFFDKSAENQ